MENKNDILRYKLEVATNFAIESAIKVESINDKLRIGEEAYRSKLVELEIILNKKHNIPSFNLKRRKKIFWYFFAGSLFFFPLFAAFFHLHFILGREDAAVFGLGTFIALILYIYGGWKDFFKLPDQQLENMLRATHKTIKKGID